MGTMTNSASETGRRILAEVAEDQVLKTADRLVGEGRGLWVWDPDADDVVALVNVDKLDRAWLIVWPAEDDFEMAETFTSEMVK